jgi:hypothetical protein
MKEILLPKKAVLGLVFISIVITILVPGVYIYTTYFNSSFELKTNKDNNFSATLEKVRGLIDLPADETPRIATISDKEKLKDQAFFNSSQVGDQVLLYYKAKKAILYRPATNKIVEVAPIFDESAQSTASGDLNPVIAASEATRLKTVILNGTNKPGLAASIESSLAKSHPEIKVLEKGNASADYQKSLLIIINPQYKARAQEIARDLNLSLEDLPEAEKNQENADILIILGQDKI